MNKGLRAKQMELAERIIADMDEIFPTLESLTCAWYFGRWRGYDITIRTYAMDITVDEQLVLQGDLAQGVVDALQERLKAERAAKTRLEEEAMEQTIDTLLIQKSTQVEADEELLAQIAEADFVEPLCIRQGDVLVHLSLPDVLAAQERIARENTRRKIVGGLAVEDEQVGVAQR